MTDAAKIDRLIEEAEKEFSRCMFPNGRAAYMREFEEKFETSVNSLKVGGGIDRTSNSFWRNNG